MWITEAAEARYRARVAQAGPDDCWPWTAGCGNHGYGLVSIGTTKRRELAHRVAYRLAYGPIPDGFHVDHECHNSDLACPGGRACRHRLCCNPSHLSVKLPDANRAASHRANERKTHCPRGHAYTIENTRIHHRNGARSCKACARARDTEPARVQAQRDRRRRNREAARCPVKP